MKKIVVFFALLGFSCSNNKRAAESEIYNIYVWVESYVEFDQDSLYFELNQRNYNLEFDYNGIFYTSRELFLDEGVYQGSLKYKNNGKPTLFDMNLNQSLLLFALIDSNGIGVAIHDFKDNPFVYE